ncbi:MAG: hypothetical protein P1U56_23215 [Saprospiraceae bacterium]|nr:hypothetical protein [Saprospiraceae bacterium]
MKTIRITFICCTVVFICSSCNKDVESVEAQFQLVDQELWTHYSAFELEAEKRGFDFNLNALQISGRIEEIPEENVAGSCLFGSHIHNEVTIDREFWNRSSPLLREFVVFHELGHCVLLRDHDESFDSQGRCLSIMRSGLSQCRDAYSHHTRDQLIDELFFQR